MPCPDAEICMTVKALNQEGWDMYYVYGS